MCQNTYMGQRVLPQLVTPALSQLAPLPEMHILNHLYGLAYMGGFKQFSQNNGYLPYANQTVTQEQLGLLNGQYIGQPLTTG